MTTRVDIQELMRLYDMTKHPDYRDVLEVTCAQLEVLTGLEKMLPDIIIECCRARRKTMDASVLSFEERRAMAIFLKMEKNRHAKDIRAIEKDLDYLRSLGVDVDNVPNWGFVSCGGGSG